MVLLLCSIHQGSKLKLFRYLSTGNISDSELSSDGYPNINQVMNQFYERNDNSCMSPGTKGHINTLSFKLIEKKLVIYVTKIFWM